MPAESFQSHSDPPLVGPKELADAVLKGRTQADWAPEHRGEISETGLRLLVEIAYYASQLPNEGHFPLLTMLVPARTPESRFGRANSMVS